MAGKNVPKIEKDKEGKEDKAQEEELSAPSNDENRLMKEMNREQLETLRFKLQKKFH
ncbi:MAG: hypothetical protein WCH01_00425 [Methylococcaceae bacterium]